MKRNRRGPKPQFLARLPPDFEGWLLERASKRTHVSSSSQGVVTRPAAGNTGRVETKEDCETSFLAGSDSVSRQTMRRKDMPLLRSPPSCHGPRVPRDITDDLESRQAALDRFTDDYFAASTRHTRDAQLQTWLRFHNRWFVDTDHQFHLLRMYWLRYLVSLKLGGTSPTEITRAGQRIFTSLLDFPGRMHCKELHLVAPDRYCEDWVAPPGLSHLTSLTL